MKTYPGTRSSPPKGCNDPRSTSSQNSRPRPIDPDALRGTKS
ncbi:hypothetical protein DMC25_00580 [Caulobacter sp. D4A]|nr:MULTISPECIES: hypothetical protein [unclassified Caulobacter]PXA94769.1 hypothetical protein DMC18_05660 [Caulobacter sp. D5]PXA95543.1 hypothetical protein DMC25_00580 [Caulobacter sp. D4A]